MSKKSKYNVNGNIGLIDADLLDKGTRHPNLVVMKLSGHFKKKGCCVSLIDSYDVITANNYEGASQYDAIYISKVFNYTKVDEKLLTLKTVCYADSV